MTAEVVYVEGNEDKPPDFTVELRAETAEERIVLSSLDGHPFNAVVVEGSRGSILRVYNMW